MIIAAIAIAVFLAFANGANDNFKGVATLYGSGATKYRTALIWATVTTFLGSITALIIANGLIASFSGKGLVADSTVANPAFMLSVGLAAAVTVQLATRFGFPISTTHALIGALVGSGLVASSTGINLEKLGTTFLLPLILSPAVAIIGAVLLYPALHHVRTRLGLTRESCVCIENESLVVPTNAAELSNTVSLSSAIAMPHIVLGTEKSCAPKKEEGAIGFTPAQAIDRMHFLSAGVVSFARGLNDTPKLAAILLVSKAISPGISLVVVALAIAVGGLISSRKVAETLSHRVTAMNPDQGFVSNFVTGLIVVFSSKLGFPVSTTHVSCGALFGIGTVTRQAKWQTIVAILLAWVTTLPVAAAIGALSILVLRPVIGG